MVDTEQLGEIKIRVNTLYKQYKEEFIKAYNKKGVVNDLLKEKCKLPIEECNIFYLDFEGMLAVIYARNGKKFYVEQIEYF